MADLVDRLVERFEREGISYCHWKGAEALDRALRGERDLDWLVAPEDWGRAVRILAAGGWRQARPRFGRDDPGTAHFFGYDPAVDRLLRLHLHDRVLTGENLINSHDLPLASALLDGTARHRGVRVPPPAATVALNVLTSAIRWGSLPDRVAGLSRGGSDPVGPPDDRAIDAAVTWLQARSLLFDDEVTFRACAASLGRGGRHRSRRRLARGVRQTLRPWARHGRLTRFMAYGQWLYVRTRRLLDGNRSNRTPTAGGVWMTVVAPPGRGAPLVAETSRWLGQAFAVRTFDGGSHVARRARRAADAGEVVLVVGASPSERATHLNESPRRHLPEPDVVLTFEDVDASAVRTRVWATLPTVEGS